MYLEVNDSEGYSFMQFKSGDKEGCKCHLKEVFSSRRMVGHRKAGINKYRWKCSYSNSYKF